MEDLDLEIATIEADLNELGRTADKIRADRQALKQALSELLLKKSGSAKLQSLTEEERAALGIKDAVVIAGPVKMGTAVNDPANS